MSPRHHWAHWHPVRRLAPVLGCLALLLAPAACSSGPATDAGPTNQPGAAGTSAPATLPPGGGSAESFCALVIQINTQLGTMVNKKFISVNQMTNAKWAELVQAALQHRAELLAAAPAELKPDVELEMQWYEAVAAANGDANAAAAPPGFGEAAGRIAQYQAVHCGITYS